jgi:hypothetical protein
MDSTDCCLKKGFLPPHLARTEWTRVMSDHGRPTPWLTQSFRLASAKPGWKTQRVSLRNESVWRVTHKVSFHEFPPLRSFQTSLALASLRPSGFQELIQQSPSKPRFWLMHVLLIFSKQYSLVIQDINSTQTSGRQTANDLMLLFAKTISSNQQDHGLWSTL